jgi:hypothetical protein
MAPSDDERDQARRTIVALLAARAAGATICPSEAARKLAGDDDFRPLMPLVRAAAQTLVDDGAIEVTQRGEPVELASARGPVRLRATRPDLLDRFTGAMRAGPDLRRTVDELRDEWT